MRHSCFLPFALPPFGWRRRQDQRRVPPKGHGALRADPMVVAWVALVFPWFTDDQNRGKEEGGK